MYLKFAEYVKNSVVKTVKKRTNHLNRPVCQHDRCANPLAVFASSFPFGRPMRF